jgi:hypothetical protein
LLCCLNVLEEWDRVGPLFGRVKALLGREMGWFDNYNSLAKTLENIISTSVLETFGVRAHLLFSSIKSASFSSFCSLDDLSEFMLVGSPKLA